MAKYKTARVLVLRALKDDAKTSETLADELGMTRRYLNRVLSFLNDAGEIFIEGWHDFERKKSGTFYAPLWAVGAQKNKAPPSPRRDAINARYRERLRARKSNAEFNAIAHALAKVQRKKQRQAAGLYRNSRTLILRLLKGEARTAGELSVALGYTVQHTTRVLRYLNANTGPLLKRSPYGREVFVEAWRNGVALWRKGHRYNARKK